MPDKEAATVAHLLVNEFICRFGVPEMLHTDQGKKFESTLIAEMCHLLCHTVWSVTRVYGV